MEGPTSTFLALLGALLLAMHLIRILPCNIVAFLYSVKRELRSQCKAQSKADELETAIVSRLHRWQRDQFRWSVAAVSFLQLYAVLVLTADAFLGVDANVFNVGLPTRRASWRILCILLNYGSMLVILRCPEVVTGRSIDAWFWLLALQTILFKSPLLCEDFHCEYFIVERLGMALLLVGRMDGVHTTLAGAAFCATAVAASALGSPVETRLDILATLMSIFFCWFLRRRARAEARATVESEFLQGQQQALRALLANFYDVVLELDEELRLVAGAPELSVFLLQGWGQRLQGRQFAELLQEETREAVMRRLTQCGQASMAEVAHAQMRSADGDRLDVELFCFSFRCPSGSRRFVLGVREYGDEQHGVPKRHEGEAVDEEISVIVDSSDSRLAILSASASFQLLVGGAQGSSFSAQLRDVDAFQRWLQTAMNEQFSGLSSRPPSCVVTFRPVGCLQTQARCSLEQLQERVVFEDLEEQELAARLVFSQLQRRRCPSGSSSRSSISSRSSKGDRAASPAALVIGAAHLARASL